MKRSNHIYIYICIYDDAMHIAHVFECIEPRMVSTPGSRSATEEH